MNKGLVLFLASGSLLLLLLVPGASHSRPAQVMAVYVTFYGFDDNDDGDPTHTGTDVISHPSFHASAKEDLGTYNRPGTLAADPEFLKPGTKVYIPNLYRYYIMEDTCRECSEHWKEGKLHIDLYVSGRGQDLVDCEYRLTMSAAVIIVDPPAGLPVKRGSACANR